MKDIFIVIQILFELQSGKSQVTLIPYKMRWAELYYYFGCEYICDIFLAFVWKNTSNQIRNGKFVYTNTFCVC